MNPNDLMEAFKDVQTPEQASWWPLAWGWWLVILLLLVVVLVVGKYVFQQIKFNAYKKRVIHQLKITSSTQQLAVLLKQLAIHYYGRTQVASLSAEKMHQFWLAQVINHSDKSAKLWQKQELCSLNDLYAQQYSGNAQAEVTAEQQAAAIKLAKQISRKNGARDV
ncbi:hypothetical protein DS2_13564 [Catenovulum agarivorans DS-2]|uniref:DUF4381 domain-containing protein n=1 Tax=Catenovulum agarivorans DS-2 TaxID=1328313 RepID=W7QJP7_9ALTE|nr:DUF4381 domain-containing protein [Catenovulum agarivorans]EWH09192.1 hypothetical protein DS2_13564 [Catenovulum agarivorans DS-2]